MESTETQSEREVDRQPHYEASQGDPDAVLMSQTGTENVTAPVEDSAKLYSLKWSSHKEQLMFHFDTLLQAECFVDVTLVCEEASFRAHKVVISACSSYLERIFANHPSKHPIVVLQGISAWELRTLLEFMYRGEVQVESHMIANLVKAASVLQIRGLTDGSLCTRTGMEDSALRLTRNTQDIMQEIEFSLEAGAGEFRPFQLPRRKQARPRRRSGDFSGALDMSIKSERPSSPSPTPSIPMATTPTPSTVPSPENLSKRQSASPKTPYCRDQASPVMETNNNNLCKATSPWPTLLNGSVVQIQDRRKGQHSAPRGGPPRAWTNNDLTEALNQVWNRKMTTSQASRVYGIPYNSLLMYVRGKYGKSLRLDALRKETLEGEAMAVAASTRGSGKLSVKSEAREAKIPRSDVNAFPGLAHLPHGFNYLNYLREFSFPLHLPLVGPMMLDERKEGLFSSPGDYVTKAEPDRSPSQSPVCTQQVESHS